VPSICRIEQKTGKFCGTVTRCGPFFANVRNGLLRTNSEILAGVQSLRKRKLFDKPASTTSQKLAQNHVQNQHNTTNRLARLLSCRAKSASRRPAYSTPNYAITPAIQRGQNRPKQYAIRNAAFRQKRDFHKSTGVKTPML
jgi:hypothetical protein